MSNFIQKAIKPSHKGLFAAKAKAAGKSTQEYAEEEKNAGGTLGKEANLALTLGKLRPKASVKLHKKHFAKKG